MASREMIERLQDFAKWAIQESAFQGADLDGLSVQEKAVELGLLTPTIYDPDKHGPSDVAEPGCEWFVFSPALDAALPQGEDVGGVVGRLRSTLFSEPAEGQRLRLVSLEAADIIEAQAAQIASLSAKAAENKDTINKLLALNVRLSRCLYDEPKSIWRDVQLSVSASEALEEYYAAWAKADKVDELTAYASELERERDEARGKTTARSKSLCKMRDKLILITDHIEDEGDRAYFGSTNDAEDLKDVVRGLEDWSWTEILKESQGDDPYQSSREAIARATAAEARASELEREVERKDAALTHPAQYSPDAELMAAIKLEYAIRADAEERFPSPPGSRARQAFEAMRDAIAKHEGKS